MSLDLWARSGALVVGVALAAGLVGGCRRAEPEADSRPRPVKTTVVEASAGTQSRAFAGRVVAAREADLAFRVPGLLETLPVREGQRVQAGTLVAGLRADEFRARAASLEGQLAQAEAVLRAQQAGQRPEERLRLEAQVRATEARLANAKAEYERFKELVAENAVARSEFELRETQFRVAEEEVKSSRQLLEASGQARAEDIDAALANVRNLRARLDEAKIQLADTQLKAPFDGVIAKRLAEESQSVSVGQPVLRFQDADEVSVAMDLPESVVVAAGREGDIIGLEAEFATLPGRSFPVQIREIAQVADPGTQTFRVRTVMRAPEGVRLLPGMTATVRVTARSGEAAGRANVPLSAVYREEGRDSVVWVVTGGGTAATVTRQPVTLGTIRGGSVEITSGLKGGERIVVAGVSRLREGMAVRDLGDALGGRP
jgi:multidrug efflux system membrane fusion protein